MPSNRQVFKNKKQKQFVTRLGYHLDSDIEAPHPLTGSFLLHDAALKGREDIVKLLITHKVDLNRLDGHSAPYRHHRTALMLALLERHNGVVDLFLKADVNPNQEDAITGQPALMQAASQADCKALGLLLEAKADINREDGEHMTALLRAAQLSYTGTAVFLIEQGAAIHNSKGKTLWDYCEGSLPLKAMQTSVEEFVGTAQELTSYLSTIQYPEPLIGIIRSYLPGFTLMQDQASLPEAPAVIPPTPSTAKMMRAMGSLLPPHSPPAETQDQRTKVLPAEAKSAGQQDQPKRLTAEEIGKQQPLAPLPPRVDSVKIWQGFRATKGGFAHAPR